jgi:hypothetical protein
MIIEIINFYIYCLDILFNIDNVFYVFLLYSANIDFF